MPFLHQYPGTDFFGCRWWRKVATLEWLIINRFHYNKIVPIDLCIRNTFSFDFLFFASLLGFLVTLHGIRKVFDVLPSVAGRRGALPLALDSLPAMTGYIEIVAGQLLMLGLFVRQTALVVSVEALLAYALVAQPRTLWPIRNGGIEALLYFVVLLYFSVAGAGAWSLDARKEGHE